jgi:uncharacterized iron-regulated membrane protein
VEQEPKNGNHPGVGVEDGEPSRGVDTAEHSNTGRWRSLWRVHFYAGIFSIPFIVLMALTGLVILYTQPIHDLFQGSLREVTASGSPLSYDQQEQAVEQSFPGVPVQSMTLPTDSHHATVFSLDDGSAAGREVFVNPYTAEILGTEKPGGTMRTYDIHRTGMVLVINTGSH